MRQDLSRSLTWKHQLSSLLLLVCVLVLATQLIASPARATGVYEILPVSADTWVVDKAEVLSRANEGKISSELKRLAEKTGYEVRIVSVRRLDYEETAQSFADKLFEQWFPTPEEQANQTVLVVDSQTNNTGIRSGEQVKTLLSDMIATSIAQETVLVPLKQGEKYNQAFLDASDRLVAVLSGKPDPGPPQVKDTTQVEGTFATAEVTKSSNATFWVITLLAVATIVPMATYYFYLYLQSR
jgi:uncharacterized protein